MENSLTLTVLYIGLVVLDTVKSFPIDVSSVAEGSNPLWLTNYVVAGFGVFLVIVSVIFGCVCCRTGKGFKEFRNSSGDLGNLRLDGFVNPTLNSEVTIFPPLGVNSNEICRFEPLPDAKNQAQNLRPAAFSYTEQEISSQDWFSDPHSNFPRNQLKYVQEYGRGWFGRVVEGEAQNIVPEERVTKVMVKILHEDATPTDHMYFLHEVKFYRDLKHPNILRLLGQCLETEPFLIILECYPNGDLKSFLSQNLASAQALVEQGVTLKMCSNITSGLQYMHKNKFIHTDLAARNCLVGPDLTVKIGDYGNSIEIFGSDYYCAGSVALPVRWCAPETLKCTDITIETREVTPPANVWTLGVVFWEICEFCKLPYAELNDDQVIVRVLGEKNYFLEKPKMFCLHADELYHLMKLCWKPPLQRPNTSQISIILENLISSKTTQKDSFMDPKGISQDFEQRWQNSKPNSIPKKDNAIEVDSGASLDCSMISSKLRNAKVVDSSFVDSPLGIFLSQKSQESPRVCLKFDKEPVNKMKRKISGETSADIETSFPKNDTDRNDLIEKKEFESKWKISNLPEKFEKRPTEVDSWLEGVEINNEEDESFVRKISEAIRDLDATLAMEKTSSSEENSGKSTRQNTPRKDGTETGEAVVEFKLGQDTSSFMNFTQKSFELSSLQNTEQPQSLNFTDTFNDKKKEFNTEGVVMPLVEGAFSKSKNDVLDESLRENDSMPYSQSRNSSDTDDEIWRRRIEKGEILEKVKEKSKSIANLMVLTHIDCDDIDIDLDKPFDKSLFRGSFNRRSGSFPKSSLSSNNFGSENNLTNAVLEEDFKESLKKLSNDHREHGHFDSLGLILPMSANRENVWENFFKPSDFSGDQNKTEKNSRSESEQFLEHEKQTTEQFVEELKQNTESENNFLANAASENPNENKHLDEKDQISASSNSHPVKCLEEENLDKNILVEVNSNCDSKCSDSLKNSSQVRESNLESIVIDNTTATEERHFNNNENESVSAVLEKNGDDDEHPTKKNEDSFNESFTPSENCTISPDDIDLQFFEKESMKDSACPDITEENKTLEEAFENSFTKTEFFESELTDSGFVPEITITNEPEEITKNEVPEEYFTMPSNFTLNKCTSVADQFENMNRNEIFYSETSPLSFSTFGKKNLDKEENTTVIVGACEDFTMDYFKGLKTTSGDLGGKEENIDVWDKHLEKAFTQQLNGANFDDITFKNTGLEPVEDKEAEQSFFDDEDKEYTISKCSVKNVLDFIESERLHTQKLEEPIQINRLTNLSVIASEEEYEHFKLRTPDDERSSDSGFRDKGSLSESVEDAYEGKYNLEDIEAELEEAFVKGVFGKNEAEKEKEFSKDLKDFNNFEYEESKFYEDENKNEDLSDIDGEIEFWQNKDESDYYPEISEFNPNCSQGWYLHPPDETTLTYNANVNEDIMKALRNELQENLPLQSRSFYEFNDFFEAEQDTGRRDLNIHCANDFSLPLSPIIEELDTTGEIAERNNENYSNDGNNGNKGRKNLGKLIESVKAIDTNTFMQYLDYMVENEGRDLQKIQEVEESIENPSPIISQEDGNVDCKKELKNSEEDPIQNKVSHNAEALFLDEDLDLDIEEDKAKDDILIINVNTNEATLVEGTPKSYRTVPKFPEEQLETMSDASENDGLVFTPEMLSPEKERSLSEGSPSSNETRTGDALSEITLSSPDLVPDCFSNSIHEDVNQTAKDNDLGVETPVDAEDDHLLENDSPTTNKSAKIKEPETTEIIEKLSNYEASDSFEMSTSFMEDNDEEDEDEFSTSHQTENNQKSKVDEWQNESSDDEGLSSSSEEFIWKLYEELQSDPNPVEVAISKSNHEDDGNNEGENSQEAEEDFDDNESSTESSASITDFVPSAWNSQATPTRSALRSPDTKSGNQKKNVWFKKQKYHCIYEYPREPSDNEDADGSPYKQSNYEKNFSEATNKHFNYEVNTVELPNKHFPYGISKVIDLSSDIDWDVVEGEDPEDSLTDTDSETGSGKTDPNGGRKNDLGFYNISPFDYDFTGSEMPEVKSEFLVSSSSRPFQGGVIQLLPGNKNGYVLENKETINSKDFVTPDSGIEDSTNLTPMDKELNQDNLYHKVTNSSYPNTGIINILENLDFNFEKKEETFGDVPKAKNGFATSDNPSELGELRHARGRLKLDLPRNHNSELVAVINKKKE